MVSRLLVFPGWYCRTLTFRFLDVPVVAWLFATCRRLPDQAHARQELPPMSAVLPVMGNEDASRSNPTRQHERKRQFGMAYECTLDMRRVSRGFALNDPAVCKAIDGLASSWMAAMAPRTSGHRLGGTRASTPEHGYAIRHRICATRPGRPKPGFVSWSLAAAPEVPGCRSRMRGSRQPVPANKSRFMHSLPGSPAHHRQHS